MDSSDDESNGLLAVSEELARLPEYKAAGSSTLDFDGLLATPLKLHEDLSNGCGGQLWPAGMVLAKYMLRKHTGDIGSRSIIELGAGGGLVGLAVALGCKVQQPIHITDQVPMLALMQQNITLNSLDGRVKASVYDWGESVPEDFPRHPDIVLAADCVYFEPAFPLLQKTLKDLIGENTVCYFCFKKRRRADLQFMKVAKKMFKVEEIQDDPDKSVYSRENLFL
ncbi:Protein-lysine N-methyltransferase efm6 [Taxawa tesnikishii (nom. ined.)]|nr:Protein-lysine N-methyltransferase efm6 [Dothideales sp. JES 119]